MNWEAMGAIGEIVGAIAVEDGTKSARIPTSGKGLGVSMVKHGTKPTNLDWSENRPNETLTRVYRASEPAIHQHA